MVIFPEKIGGKYWCYHRPVGRTNIRKLAIVSGQSPDLLHWGQHQHVLHCQNSGWYSGRIGAGTPPVRTRAGWLTLFHGVEYCGPKDKTGTYRAGAMLTDLNDPNQILAVSQDPFFEPELDFEKHGFVNNVVFPTGAIVDEEDPDTLLVYYGAADSCVAVTAFSIEEILQSLGH